MIEEKAILEFQDSELLAEVIEQYNKRYSRTSRKCETKEIKPNLYEIKLKDDGKLIPYGIFELGVAIGEKWMSKNYRIKLTGWYKLIKETIYEKQNYPGSEIVSIKLKDDQLFEAQIKKFTSVNSSFGIIRPYLEEEDFDQIASLSEFKLVPNIKSKIYQTDKSLRINFIVKDNYLLIFGTDLKNRSDYYRVDLESVFEIEKHKYDI